MNKKAFSLGLVISLISMFMVYTYIEDQTKSLKSEFGLEKTVVVASQDIQELELIDDSKITLKTVPAKFRSPGSFSTIKDVQNTIATVPILKGEQLTRPRVEYPGARTGLARQVSAGKRAMAILVSDRSAVGKLIKPGDRVDVVAAISYAPGRRDKDKTSTVLQDVLVLSTGYNITNSTPLVAMKENREIRKLKLDTYTGYNTVTLEVDPFQVQILTHVIKNMDPNPILVLRNNNDKEKLRIPMTEIFDLLGDKKAEAREFFQKQNSDN